MGANVEHPGGGAQLCKLDTIMYKIKALKSQRLMMIGKYQDNQIYSSRASLNGGKLAK